MRVVVVGAGPKGLQALGELARRAGVMGRTDLDVTVVDPRPPGTGAAYDVAQPEHLRLNVQPGICEVPPLPPLPQWASERGTPLGDDVPRALVGRYLAEVFGTLSTSAGFPVRHRAATAVSANLVADGWRLILDDGTALDADQVLLATGHAADWPGALRHAWSSPLPLVPAVYPVSELGSIQPGARVAVRGAALTFIDLVLSLTEGRPREQWPAVVLPTGRSGALLSAKPAPLADPALDALSDDPVELMAQVVTLATDLLARATGRDADRAEVQATLDTGWEAHLREPVPGRSARALAVSIAVADGRREPGAAWALGRTWAARYADVVSALSFADRGAGWPDLLRRAAVLERLTFGPPLGNARRLLAAIESGVVDVSWLEAGVRIDGSGVHGVPAGQAGPDVVVDAVLAPPGARQARNPLVDRLLEAGHLHLAEERRGIAVDRDGFAAPGLALVGRPLEDVVVGNDTLSRTLHDLPARWATRVLASGHDGADQPRGARS